MKYYKVKPQYDQHPLYKWGNGRNAGKLNKYSFMVSNELFTEAERAKIANCDYFFEPVEIKKTNTHLFFGARFENGTSYDTK